MKTPTLLIAANREAPGADPKEKSLREEQILSALSDALKSPMDVSCGKGMEAKAAALAISHPGPVLICWGHNKIVEMAELISPGASILTAWDSARFDMISFSALRRMTRVTSSSRSHRCFWLAI